MKFDTSCTGRKENFRLQKECPSLPCGLIKSIKSEVNVIQKPLPISFNHLKVKTCINLVNGFKILK